MQAMMQMAKFDISALLRSRLINFIYLPGMEEPVNTSPGQFVPSLIINGCMAIYALCSCKS